MMFVGVLSSKYINKFYEVKNSITFFKTLSVFFVLLFVYFFDYSTFTINTDKFDFMNDYLIYVLVILNFSNQVIWRKFTKHNEKNLIFTQYANFLFVATVPIVSFIFIKYLNFDESINLEYKNIGSALFLSGLIVFLSFFIFIDKIKNKNIERMDVMIGAVLSSSITAVLTIKMMQKYDVAAVYIFTIIINVILYAIFSIRNKEYNKYQNKKNIKSITLTLVILYVLYSQLNIYVVSILPAEYISIIRVVSAMFISAIFDFYMNGKKINITIKDLFFITLIILSMFLFSY
jgi:hypothetical protein